MLSVINKDQYIEIFAGWDVYLLLIFIPNTTIPTITPF